MRKVIVNSTPIIALSKVGRLGLLQQMYGEIIIPYAVYQEVTEKNDAAVRAIKDNASWMHIVRIYDQADRKMYKARLHEGEVEVMILAQEIHADLVIIDDLAARKTAEYLDLTLTGTIGILVKAKRLGLISEVMPIIKEMESHNIYFSESLISRIRKLANE